MFLVAVARSFENSDGVCSSLKRRLAMDSLSRMREATTLQSNATRERWTGDITHKQSIPPATTATLPRKIYT